MTDVSPLQKRFVSLMESIARAEGISPNAGRILGYLIMQENPVSFADLAHQLKISRGSVSENTCLLIEHGVIRRVQVPGKRGDAFEVRQDASAALLERRRRMTLEVIADLNEMQNELPEASFQRERMQGFEQFLTASLIAADVLEEKIFPQKDKQKEKKNT